MTRIPEEFVPLHVRYRRDRAIRRVGNDGELMYLRGLAHAKGERTSGHLEDFDLDDIGSGIADKHDVAARLVEEGLWVKVADGWLIRSFEKWNPGAGASVDGLRGNHVRWHQGRGAFDDACQFCVAEQTSIGANRGDIGAMEPDDRGDDRGDSGGESQRREEKSRDRVEIEKKREDMSELRPDVVSLLDHLDSRIAGNGLKPPTRSKANVDAARLLLDRDGVGVGDAHRLIDWATGHDFWMDKVLSMAKFRKHHQQMLLQARRGPSERFAAPTRTSATEAGFDRLQAQFSGGGL